MKTGAKSDLCARARAAAVHPTNAPGDTATRGVEKRRRFSADTAKTPS